MKKMIVCTLLVLALITSTCFAFADELYEPVTDPDITDYVEARTVRSHLIIKDGYAVCKTRVDVENSSSANKMIVTVKYIKHNVGTVSTKTATVYRSGVSFTATTKYLLASSGSYHCKVTIKLYNGTSLLETISVLTNTVIF